MLISAILILIAWIRVQGIKRLPAGQFTETDGYFYYWQAHLPARDMPRWLPLGRDLGQTLHLYGYVLAYTHNETLDTLSLILATLAVGFCLLRGLPFFFTRHR